ncbi:MAG: hypothetical protein RLO50_11650 [Azospirillaceae bacterium]
MAAQVMAALVACCLAAAATPALADDRTPAQGLADPTDGGGGELGGGGGLSGVTNDSATGGEHGGSDSRLGVLIPIGDDGSGRPLEERVPEILAELNPAQLMLVRSHCWSLYSTARNWTGDLRTFCSEVIDRE